MFFKGFSLSLISFMKWILSLLLRLFWYQNFNLSSDYIQSEFITMLGLGLAIFIFTLFITILDWKNFRSEQ